MATSLFLVSIVTGRLVMLFPLCVASKVTLPMSSGVAVTLNVSIGLLLIPTWAAIFIMLFLGAMVFVCVMSTFLIVVLGLAFLTLAVSSMILLFSVALPIVVSMPIDVAVIFLTPRVFPSRHIVSHPFLLENIHRRDKKHRDHGCSRHHLH